MDKTVEKVARKVINMLKIHFGELDSAEYGPSWFKYNYKPEWLKDELVQKMIKDVDNSTYVDGLVIDSPILGPIPPERLISSFLMKATDLFLPKNLLNMQRQQITISCLLRENL